MIVGSANRFNPVEVTLLLETQEEYEQFRALTCVPVEVIRKHIPDGFSLRIDPATWSPEFMAELRARIQEIHGGR